MSWQPAEDPVPGDRRSCNAIEIVIVPRVRDLGGFSVRRALPSARRQMVGPFIFWDQMGPAEFALGEGIGVRPHPHIGLATVTYLFEGEIVHRDSLGSAQIIAPGDVNWMTAGKGIVHSERSAEEWKAKANRRMFGIQSWVALPRAAEEAAPEFFHHGAQSLPMIEAEGKRVRIIAGSLFGQTSPVHAFSSMFYADVALDAGAKAPLPAEHEERAIYIASGTVEIAGDRFESRPASRLPARRRNHDRSSSAEPPAFPGRRAHGRPAPHLVEFRLLLARADRAGEGGLGTEALRPCAR